jgi:phage repressor protein C with HTH and peptisase S24 domain
MDPILDAIDEGLKRKGLSDAAASMLAVGNFALIKNMRSARSAEKRYNFQALERLAKVLDLECYFGERRAAPTAGVVVLDSDDYIPVPRIDVRLSAGPGAMNHDPRELERIAFHSGWLRRLGVRPADAVLVGVAGDSMAPGLRDGDVALVDRGRRTVRSGHVYALSDIDGSTRVKRVDLVPNQGYVLRSDAPDHPAELRFGIDGKAVRIEGQVVWSGHTWRA